MKKENLNWTPRKEDVHSNIESYPHSPRGNGIRREDSYGRSRNDQIAVDMRLYLRDSDLGVCTKAVDL